MHALQPDKYTKVIKITYETEIIMNFMKAHGHQRVAFRGCGKHVVEWPCRRSKKHNWFLIFSLHWRWRHGAIHICIFIFSILFIVFFYRCTYKKNHVLPLKSSFFRKVNVWYGSFFKFAHKFLIMVGYFSSKYTNF